MKKVWYKPDMEVWDFCGELIKAPHVLIAGATNAGKNVFLDDMMFSLLGSYSPAQAKYILIDPKRIELTKYRSLPFCAGYASEPEDIIRTIDGVINEMEMRYAEMQRKGDTLYDGPALYLIIDELADLMVTIKRHILPRLQRLAQLGRSARVHVWACSQSPSRRTIPAELTLNFTHRVALRCESNIESKQVIGRAGAELLPLHGECIIKYPGRIYKQEVPMLDDWELKERLDFWRYAKPKTKLI